MPVTLKVILSDKPKRNGTYPVLLRITADRKTHRPGLGIFIVKKDFNPAGVYHKANWIRTSNARHDSINTRIKGIIDETETLISVYQRNGTLLTSESVKGIVKRVIRGDTEEGINISFTEFFRQIMAEYLPDQVGSHTIFERALYCLTCYAGENIQFRDMGDKFVSGFFKFLTTKYQSPKTKKPLSINSANAYIARVATVVQRAKKTVILVNGKRTPLIRQENDPFLHYKKTKALEPMIEILDPAEMALIEQMELPKGSKIWHARNLFLMQYYLAGSRVSDALLLTWAKVDNLRVEYYSLKTKTLHSIKNHDKIQGILARYKKKEGFIFPYFQDDVDYSNKKFADKERKRHIGNVNYYLGRIMKKLGITKHVHTHVSRHSFTSSAILAGTSIFDVSKAIGHSKITTTENYANRIKQTASDSAIDSVFKKNVAESLPPKKEEEGENSPEKPE